MNYSTGLAIGMALASSGGGGGGGSFTVLQLIIVILIVLSVFCWSSQLTIAIINVLDPGVIMKKFKTSADFLYWIIPVVPCLITLFCKVKNIGKSGTSCA